MNNVERKIINWLCLTEWGAFPMSWAVEDVEGTEAEVHAALWSLVDKDFLTDIGFNILDEQSFKPTYKIQDKWAYDYPVCYHRMTDYLT